jgi:hypothetical protein
MTAGALKRRFSNVQPLRKCARFLHILIGVQLLLGASAWWSRVDAAPFPQPIAIMVTLTVVHTVTGALLLATTLMTTLVSYRMLRPGHALVNSSSTPEMLAR